MRRKPGPVSETWDAYDPPRRAIPCFAGDNDYFLCMDEECDIAYYNAESNVRFDKWQLKTPIWFKKDADPKYACYCSKVTEEQVMAAVLRDGAVNMKKVLRITGAMSDSQCQKKNPLGKCCHRIIQAAMDKALHMNASVKNPDKPFR